MRGSAPPFSHPCYYGTDIDSEETLIAGGHSPAMIAKMIGADSLGFLPVEALPEMAGADGICRACFDGVYPTKIPAAGGKKRFERRFSERFSEE